MAIKFCKNPMSGEDSYLDEEREIYYMRVIGGITWQPPTVVICGQGDVFRPPRPVYVLAEYEEKSIGDLIRRCSVLSNSFCADNFYGKPDPVCLRYIDSFNAEAGQSRLKRFYFQTAPSTDLPMDFHYNLLRDRLRPGAKTLHFAEGSQIKGQLLAVPEAGEPIKDDGLFPLVSALSYCIAALSESESLEHSRGKHTFYKHEYDVLKYDP